MVCLAPVVDPLARSSVPPLAPWVPIAVGAAFAALVAGLGVTLHPIPVPVSGEDDNYLHGLASLLGGGACYDHFHPVHPVLFGALLHHVFGCGPFAALRLVSAISGGTIVAITLVLARQLGGRAFAWLAAAAVAVHPGVLLLSMQASSDALATALGLSALAAALRVCAGGGLGASFVAGLCGGLALGARFTVIAFAAAPVFACRRQRWRCLLAAAIGGVLGFAPHAFVAWRETGSPFVNENWRNVVLKHGGYAPHLIPEPGFDGPLPFLREHGLEVLRLGIADLWQQVRGGFGALITGGRTTFVGAVAGLLVLATVVVLALRRTRPHLLFAGCFVAHWMLVCFTFHTDERILLPLVPLAAVALAALSDTTLRAWSCRTALLAVGALSAAAIPARFAEFSERHPHAEIAAARELAARPGVEFLIATWTNMPLHAPQVSGWLPELPLSERDADPAAWLRAAMAGRNANGFVIGRRSAPLLHERAAAATFPPDFEVVRADGDVVVLVVRAHFPDGGEIGHWFQHVGAAPNPWSEGTITLTAAVRPEAEIARVAQVDVRLEPPPDRGPMLVLQRSGERQWQVLWTARPPPGSWCLQFHVRLIDGRCVLGPRVPLTVR